MRLGVLILLCMAYITLYGQGTKKYKIVKTHVEDKKHFECINPFGKRITNQTIGAVSVHEGVLLLEIGNNDSLSFFIQARGPEKSKNYEIINLEKDIDLTSYSVCEKYSGKYEIVINENKHLLRCYYTPETEKKPKKVFKMIIR